MAASVQELLLAAQAKAPQKSPLVQLIESGMAGYDVGLQDKVRNVEIAKKMIEINQSRQEKLAQEKMALQMEKDLRDGQDGISGLGTPATPTAKFKREWNVDEKGKISSKITKVDPPAPKEVKVPSSIEEGIMDRVNKGEISLEEGIALKSKAAKQPVDMSMQRAITKAKVELAESRPLVTSAIAEIERVEKLNKKSRGGWTGAATQKMQSGLNVGTDSPEFKNTADVLNTMKAQVARILKSTFGGQLSDGERAYLNEVYGALGTMSPAEREIAMTNVKTTLRSKLDASESKLRELQFDAGIDMPDERTGTQKTKTKEIPSDNSDLSGMSDEELRAIAGGQ